MKQISITVKAKAAALERVVGVLSAKGVDIRALTLGASTHGRGSLEIKMLVNDAGLAADALHCEGIPFADEDVLVIAVDDHPGGLHAMLKVLAEAEIDPEHLYGFVSKKEGKALDVLRVKDPAKAAAVLKKHHIVVLDEHPAGRGGRSFGSR